MEATTEVVDVEVEVAAAAALAAATAAMAAEVAEATGVAPTGVTEAGDGFVSEGNVVITMGSTGRIGRPPIESDQVAPELQLVKQ